ncbi:MAG: hypothetical protein J2P55_15610 [Rhizobiales bacterium]|nr:hypothetical protein [Hyphomicrobiales bacterium]
MRRHRRRPLKISNMIFRMGKLVLMPGDVIVLQTDLRLTIAQIEALSRRAREQFKPFKVIILSAGMKVGVLRKAKR